MLIYKYIELALVLINFFSLLPVHGKYIESYLSVMSCVRISNALQANIMGSNQDRILLGNLSLYPNIFIMFSKF